jgi:uncharacterized protein (DUF952 family)
MKYRYHIAKNDDWQKAKKLGIYENQSLETQGLIFRMKNKCRLRGYGMDTFDAFEERL